MVGLGVAIGLSFPIFLENMQIATPTQAWSVRSRAGCLVAGLLVGGINYALARIVLGGRLRQSSARYRALIDQSSDLVLVTDRNGFASFLSPSAERLLTPFRKDSPTTRPHTQVDLIDLVGAVEEKDQPGLLEAMHSAVPGCGSAIEIRIAGEHGVRTLDVTIEDLTGEPSVGGLVLTAHDVTDRLALQHEMQYRALHDELTGLPNRTLLADRLAQALRTDARMTTCTGLLLIDLDRFKEINDTFGHHHGDGRGARG